MRYLLCDTRLERFLINVLRILHRGKMKEKEENSINSTVCFDWFSFRKGTKIFSAPFHVAERCALDFPKKH